MTNSISFLKKVYINFIYGLMAFIAFAALFAYLQVPKFLLGLLNSGWIAVIGLIIFLIATYWLFNVLQTSSNRLLQYVGLFGYAMVESLIFSPLLYIASTVGILIPVIVITVITFGILTAIVFMSGINFSFLKNFLILGSIVSLIFLIVSAIVGFNLTILFTTFMLILSAGWILYDTSNIANEYTDGQEVAAAGQLLASVLLLFWYIIRFLLEILNFFND
jgi:uncharacterized protein